MLDLVLPNMPLVISLSHATLLSAFSGTVSSASHSKPISALEFVHTKEAELCQMERRVSQPLTGRSFTTLWGAPLSQSIVSLLPFLLLRSTLLQTQGRFACLDVAYPQDGVQSSTIQTSDLTVQLPFGASVQLVFPSFKPPSIKERLASTLSMSTKENSKLQRNLGPLNAITLLLRILAIGSDSENRGESTLLLIAQATSKLCVKRWRLPAVDMVSPR